MSTDVHNGARARDAQRSAATTHMADIGWWNIHGEALMDMMRRAQSGDDAEPKGGES